MKKSIVKKRKYYTEGLPPLQWMRQSRRERKLLPVPPHPPYIKVSQLYVSLLNPHLVRVELHGPWLVGSRHRALNVKVQYCYLSPPLKL